jgi:mannose-6-phosphate isomerase-like protein (cupin superfamily)|tara:strand:- start:7284 stop:7553 length:270 start_codon:yes stop_codon:yes gene_type:complete
MTEDDFRELLTSQGCDEPRENSYLAGYSTELHTHEFGAQLLVLEGEFILELEDGKHIFKAGETCQVPSGTLHAEHTGEVFARTLVGRTH